MSFSRKLKSLPKKVKNKFKKKKVQIPQNATNQNSYPDLDTPVLLTTNDTPSQQPPVILPKRQVVGVCNGNILLNEETVVSSDEQSGGWISPPTETNNEAQNAAPLLEEGSSSQAENNTTTITSTNIPQGDLAIPQNPFSITTIPSPNPDVSNMQHSLSNLHEELELMWKENVSREQSGAADNNPTMQQDASENTVGAQTSTSDTNIKSTTENDKGKEKWRNMNEINLKEIEDIMFKYDSESEGEGLKKESGYGTDPGENKNDKLHRSVAFKGEHAYRRKNNGIESEHASPKTSRRKRLQKVDKTSNTNSTLKSKIMSGFSLFGRHNQQATHMSKGERKLMIQLEKERAKTAQEKARAEQERLKVTQLRLSIRLEQLKSGKDNIQMFSSNEETDHSDHSPKGERKKSLGS